MFFGSAREQRLHGVPPNLNRDIEMKIAEHEFFQIDLIGSEKSNKNSLRRAWHALVIAPLLSLLACPGQPLSFLPDGGHRVSRIGKSHAENRFRE